MRILQPPLLRLLPFTATAATGTAMPPFLFLSSSSFSSTTTTTITPSPPLLQLRVPWDWIATALPSCDLVPFGAFPHFSPQIPPKPSMLVFRWSWCIQMQHPTVTTASCTASTSSCTRHSKTHFMPWLPHKAPVPRPQSLSNMVASGSSARSELSHIYSRRERHGTMWSASCISLNSRPFHALVRPMCVAGDMFIEGWGVSEPPFGRPPHAHAYSFPPCQRECPSLTEALRRGPIEGGITCRAGPDTPLLQGPLTYANGEERLFSWSVSYTARRCLCRFTCAAAGMAHVVHSW